MVDILRSGKLLGQSSDEVKVNNGEKGQQHSNVNIIPVEPEERSEGIEKLQVLVTDFSKGRKKPTRPHLPLDGLDVHEKPKKLVRKHFHIYVIFISMSFSYLCHFHIYVIFISMSFSYLRHFHIYVIFISMSFSYLCHFYIYVIFISMSFSYLRHFHIYVITVVR